MQKNLTATQQVTKMIFDGSYDRDEVLRNLAMFHPAIFLKCAGVAPIVKKHRLDGLDLSKMRINPSSIVESIRAYREVTKVSLHEAKYVVDAVLRGSPLGEHTTRYEDAADELREYLRGKGLSVYH